MNKIIKILFLSLGLVISISVTGCTQANDTNKNEPPTQQQTQSDLNTKSDDSTQFEVQLDDLSESLIAKIFYDKMKIEDDENMKVSEEEQMIYDSLSYEFKEYVITTIENSMDDYEYCDFLNSIGISVGIGTPIDDSDENTTDYSTQNDDVVDSSDDDLYDGNINLKYDKILNDLNNEVFLRILAESIGYDYELSEEDEIYFNSLSEGFKAYVVDWKHEGRTDEQYTNFVIEEIKPLQ